MISLVPIVYILLAGGTFYAGIHHFLIAADQSRKGVHAVFATMCFLSGFLSVSLVWMMQAETLADYLPVLRWNVFLAVAGLMLLFWFLALYCRNYPKPLLIAFTAFWAVLLIANAYLPHTVQYQQITGFEIISLAGAGKMFRPVGQLGPGFYLAALGALLEIAIGLYFLYSKHRKFRERTTLWMMIAVGIYLISAIGGILSRMSVINIPPTGPFGFLAMLLVMSQVLIYEARSKSNLVQAVLDHLPDVVYAKTLDGRYILANQHCGELLKVSPDSIPDKTVFDFFPAEQARAMEDSDRITLASVDEVPLEHTVTVRGEERAYLTRKFPLRDASNRAYAICGISTDITERIKAEKKLQEAHDLAIHFSQAKSRFLANMSHEIRTPMNAVLGFSELGMHETSQEVVQNYLLHIHSSASHLLGIINDILDYSRIEAGKLEITEAPFLLGELFSHLKVSYTAQAEQKGITLEFLQNDNIPDRLAGDSTRLLQILTNLIGNAIKFSHKGKVLVWAELVSRKKSQLQLQFAVMDEGIGIHPEAQKTLFQPFSQADASSTRRYGGTGLGLSICKQLVELMGGSIHVDSAPGQGSTFSFTIPLKVDTGTPAKEAAADAVLPQLPGKRILVVEDNPTNQAVAQKLLERIGVDVTLAHNGREAVEILSGQTFDAVLMDIQMPELSGDEATMKIRQELGLTLPIIAMTAHAMPGEREKCLQAGMDDVITKPVDVPRLYKLLSQYLTR
jgi:PAS domain S-box-containing protein